ncbi:PREDICTED: serine/threonine-protein kinase EDR1-like [Camelina sativa]|uniref:Serine/threonine-protein kinase EDR1-like n=1 Tax=Camelina sativa TaxID=90675 RepID=A0ABM1Q6G0_CAMSA|nr:PREDICTED: serine/threonine-protein kinase EDR1-like [Camelina sativa]XP_019082348.1 PREDICTED: serine/threonine-protein kinase EDR1-like [Camelina sativa]
MGANCCRCHKGTVESVQGSIMSLADLKNQARDLKEVVVEETRDDAGPSEPIPPSPNSSPSEVEVLATDEVSSYEASNYLWSTGLFPYPILSGFYSVVPVGRLKLSKSIPTLEEINALRDHERLKAGVICVDFRKDHQLALLKMLYYGQVRGLNSEPVKLIKKTAELVVKAKRSQSFKSRGFPLLGNIKHGSCRARAILFKVLADTVRLESKLVVGFPSDLGSSSSVDPCYHMSVVVALDGVEMLVDLKRCPGQLKPFSPKEVYLAHVSTAWQTGFVDSDSCASPLEPYRPMERSGSPSVLQSGSSGSRSELIIKEQRSPGSSSNSNGTAEPETERIRSRRMKTPEISPGEESQMEKSLI